MTEFNISYVTTDSISEGVGSSQILPFVKNLGRAGYSVNLISYEKNAPSEEIRGILQSLGIVWTTLEFDMKSKLGGVKRIFELQKKIRSSDVIHARSDIPTFSGILSERGPVVWDVRSLWADQRLFMEDKNLRRIGLNTSKLLERYSARNAAGLSTLTHKVVPILLDRHKKLPGIKIVVPTAVDLQKFQMSTTMKKPIRALYSGTYNKYYDLKLSQEFTDKLRSFVPLEIAWSRPHESQNARLGVGESQIFTLTQNEMSKLIPDYSFGISVCRNDAGISLKAAMPTKIAEFLACGRPVVVNKGLGDLDEFLTEFNAGIILDGTSDNLSKAVNQMLDLISDPETPMRCRALAEKYFSLEEGTKKYLSLYGDLSKEIP